VPLFLQYLDVLTESWCFQSFKSFSSILTSIYKAAATVGVGTSYPPMEGEPAKRDDKRLWVWRVLSGLSCYTSSTLFNAINLVVTFIYYKGFDDLYVICIYSFLCRLLMKLCFPLHSHCSLDGDNRLFLLYLSLEC
jgi:hypothetical protein